VNAGPLPDTGGVGIDQARIVEATEVQLAAAGGGIYELAINQTGVVRATSDGGASWNDLSTGTTSDLKGVSFVSATTGWVGGQNDTLLFTDDGGATWTVEAIDPAVYKHGGGAGDVWVQRLTVPEYIATVRSAVGVDIAREARELLPPDLRADGFNNTAYNLSVDLKHVDACRLEREQARSLERVVEEFVGRTGPIAHAVVQDAQLLACRSKLVMAAVEAWQFSGPLHAELLRDVAHLQPMDEACAAGRGHP